MGRVPGLKGALKFLGRLVTMVCKKFPMTSAWCRGLWISSPERGIIEAMPCNPLRLRALKLLPM